MTAKDKARELVSNMLQWQPLSTDERTEEMNVNFAKQCALIAVDEIIDTLNQTTLEFEYWEEVKQEIKAL